MSRSRYNENSLQREIVEYLNGRSGLGCKVSRIKNGGTYDPIRKAFRSNNAEKGIPDIIGCTKNGKAIFIEVKMLTVNGELKPIRKEQVDYLGDMADRNALVGIAYDLGDAFDIVVDDPVKYPRKDRTYGNRKLRARLAKEGHKTKAKSRKRQDPLYFLHDLIEEKEREESDAAFGDSGEA